MLFRIVTVALCLFVSNLSAADAPKLTLSKVKLALNWVPEPEFGGFYAAKIKGIYEKYGIDVEIIPGGAGSPTVQMVAAGKIEFAVTSGEEVIVSRARGADVIAVFSVYQKSPLAIMAHKERNLRSIADVFSSGTLAIEKGRSFYEFLKKKYDFSKVKVVPYTGGVASFLHDPKFAQQGFMFSEPILAKRQGANPQVFLIADAGYNPYMEVLAVKGDYLKTHESLVKNFVQATREGWKEYLRSPDEANQHMAKLNKAMDPLTFKECAEAQTILIDDEFAKKNGLGAMSETRWKEHSEQLVALKVIEKAVSPSEYFKNY